MNVLRHTVVVCASHYLVIAVAASATVEVEVALDSQDPFLLQNGLMSITVSLTGFEDGQSIQGIAGNLTHPWVISTTHQVGFFNVPSEGLWNGEQVFAPNPAMIPFVDPDGTLGLAWDSGLLDVPEFTTQVFPAGFGNFARASSGENESVSGLFWGTAQQGGVIVDSDTTIDLFRVTFCPNYHSIQLDLVVEMNSPGGSHNFSVPFPWIGGGPCHRADVSGDLQVNVTDLLDLLSAWGECDLPCLCPADQDGDGTVNVFDLLLMLQEWGDCEE